jgi:hypothetical protein
MDPAGKKRRINLLWLFLALLLSIFLMAWMWYDAWIVRRDPFFLFIGYNVGYYGPSFFSALAFFFLVAVVFYFVYTRKIPFILSAGNTGASPDGNGQSQVSTTYRPFSISQEKILDYGLAVFMSLWIIGGFYALDRSLPLTLVVIGVIIACYAIVKFLVRPSDAPGMIFSAIMLCVVFPVASICTYFFVPGYTSGSPLQRIIVHPFPLIISLIWVAMVVGSWFKIHGIPVFRPLTDTDLQELYEEEIVLSLPFDRVFELCRDSVRLLPNSQITTADPVFGTLSASASPGWGRSSSVSFTLERIHEGKTRVKISSISPIPSNTNEPRKLTWVNRKYVKILVTYLLSQ